MKKEPDKHEDFYKIDIDLEEMVDLAKHVASDIWGPRDPLKLMAKLREEVGELGEALRSIANPSDKFDVIKELGDVLFCIFRLADNVGLDPASALGLSIVKIQERDKFNVANRKPADER
jgi:NTP pyrophosphatase (non-canonical NTP hydrolase)